MSIKFEITKSKQHTFWNCSSSGRAGRLLYIGKLVGDPFVCGSIFWAYQCEA